MKIDDWDLTTTNDNVVLKVLETLNEDDEIYVVDDMDNEVSVDSILKDFGSDEELDEYTGAMGWEMYNELYEREMALNNNKDETV